MSWPIESHEAGHNRIVREPGGTFAIYANGYAVKNGLTVDELIKACVKAAELRIIREIKAIIADFDRPLTWEDLYEEGDPE